MADQNEEPKGLFYLIVGLFCIGCLFQSTIQFKSYFHYQKLQQHGTYTTAKIVKRIYEPQNRAPTIYYLTYQFENRRATNTCKRSGEYFTTPKDKACIHTVQRHRILEQEYKDIKIGDEIDILYLPSDSKTKSLVLGMSYSKSSSLYAAFFYLFLALCSVWWLLVFISKGFADKERSKRARKTKRSEGL